MRNRFDGSARGTLILPSPPVGVDVLECGGPMLCGLRRGATTHAMTN